MYPLGLAYLAASLRGHVVKIIDQNLLSDSASDTEVVLREFKPDVVGISIRNLRVGPTADCGSRVLLALHSTVKTVRRVCPSVVTVVGGCAFSMFPERFLAEEPMVDFGILLEGDLSLPQLLANLDTPRTVPGVYYRDGAEIRLSGPPAFPDFSTLPHPRRDLLDHSLYQGEDVIGVQSKRGCALNCVYCSYPYLTGHRCGLRAPEDVADEVESLVRDHGLRQFTFVDNVFNIPESHAVEICTALEKRQLGATWSAWFNEQSINANVLDLAVRAGCRCVELSPDGYGNASLAWLNKNIRTEDIKRAFRVLAAHKDLSVVYNFFVGIPGQGIPATVRQYLFVRELKRELGPRLKGIRFNSLWIEPNTPLASRAQQEGRISHSTDLFHTTLYEVGSLHVLRQLVKRSRTGHGLLRRLRRRFSLSDFDDVKPA